MGECGRHKVPPNTTHLKSLFQGVIQGVGGKQIANLVLGTVS